MDFRPNLDGAIIKISQYLEILLIQGKIDLDHAYHDLKVYDHFLKYWGVSC